MTVLSELHAGIAAAVGHTRAYPSTLPSAVTMPALTYFRVSGLPAGSHTGARATRERWQVTAFGSTPAQAEAEADKIESAFNGARGGAGDIENVQLAGRNSFYDPEANRYQAMVDLWIWRRIAGAGG